VAVTADVTGKVYAWGDNTEGQTGHEWTDFEEDCGGRCVWLPRLVPMPDAEVAVQTVACGSHHTLVLSTMGKMYAWGMNKHGELGTGLQHGERGGDAEPQGVQPVALDVHTLAISCGASHSAAITVDGALYTWGKNFKYQLGHGDKKTKATPTRVVFQEAVEVAAVACGFGHTICLSLEKMMYIWGKDDCPSGCLGIPKAKKDEIPELREPFCLSTEAGIDKGLYARPVLAIAAGPAIPRNCVHPAYLGRRADAALVLCRP